MQSIGTYLLRLTAAALICGIITAFFEKKGAFDGVMRLLAGIFLTLNILSPWVQLRLDGWMDWVDGFSVSADGLSQAGENAARDAMAKGISEKTQAYILDKAQSLGAQVQVEVILDDSAIPVPCGVRLTGNISPYAKQTLTHFLETELGISPEEQRWT